MYAKVFSQIFDSSIADNYPLRHFFMDLLVLADCDGVVGMTPTAIAARTRIPLAEVTAMLAALEQPDHESRTPDHDGRRIARLDNHRSWGWCIINYDKFRKIASDEQRREKTRLRTLKWREKSACDAPVTHGDAGDAMQKQNQNQKNKTQSAARPVVIPESINTPEFSAAWTKWLEHLKQKRKPATDHAQELQLQKLAALGADKAIETINHCIEKNWQGIYEATAPTAANGNRTTSHKGGNF